MTSWNEIRGKIKHAYDEIESAYENYLESSVDKVKERPLLNKAVKTALPFVPTIGPILSALYDNIGGKTRSEEDKAKQILDFLGKLEQQDKEHFDRIAQDLKTNRDVINDAINQNRFTIADLISRSSAELLEAVGKVKEDTAVIRVGVQRIETLLEKRDVTHSEIRRPPKPSIFRGESTKIFVGRNQDINTIRNYFAESNFPVSITGEGGIGKSELAYKAMHKCEDMFDLVIPVYFGSLLTFESFLLEIVKGLNLPIDEFEKKQLALEERRQFIIDTLGQGEFKHPLIYADNYETISRALAIKDSSVLASEGEKKDDARKINSFLENLPPNTAVLLTSRERHNLDGERPVRLDGLSETEGRVLFIKLAENHFPKGGPSEEIKRALEEISRKAGGHPLSIELLARSYRGQGLSRIREMLEDMGAGVVNPKEEIQRLQSLERCFEYSFDRLPQTHKDLLPKLIIFYSPFPSDAVQEIFGLQDGSEVLLDLYDHSLLRSIDFSEYASDDGDGVDTTYHLYYFHPAIRNYLDHKVVGGANRKELQDAYGHRFYLYYYKLLQETYDAIGTKDHVFSLGRFNVIWQGKENDFDRAMRLAKDSTVESTISSYLGLILNTLGRYSSALESFKKSLAIDEELNDRVGMAEDYRNIGAVLDSQGNYDQALEYHNRALAIHEELQDIGGMASNYGNIGIVLQEQGNYDQALEYHKKSLAIDEELNDRVGMALDYTNIGAVLDSQGNYDQALEYHKKSLAIHEELQDIGGMARDYVNIGLVFDQQGNYDQALEYHKEALKIHEALNDRVRMARAYGNIGVVLDSQGNYDQALEYHKKSLAIHEELQDIGGMASNYGNIGIVLQEQGNYDQALEYHKKSLAIHEELQDRVEIAKDHVRSSFVLANIKDHNGEIESLSKGLEILQGLEEKTGYHHPLIDKIQGIISQLQEEKDKRAKSQ